ncbi:hypothetical protein BC828DRAFT_131381 [Blastocladiella britannica]|nr:hypothetical protein BC828DRAFT_131381 [Blastocladiella britannica]
MSPFFFLFQKFPPPPHPSPSLPISVHTISGGVLIYFFPFFPPFFPFFFMFPPQPFSFTRIFVPLSFFRLVHFMQLMNCSFLLFPSNLFFVLPFKKIQSRFKILGCW